MGFELSHTRKAGKADMGLGPLGIWRLKFVRAGSVGSGQKVLPLLSDPSSLQVFYLLVTGSKGVETRAAESHYLTLELPAT